MAKLKNYADVQQALKNFVDNAGVSPAGAPHGVFWEKLNYEEFVSNNVPGVYPQTKILEKGDADNSTLIKVLKGESDIYPQMPQPSPPYDGQDELIKSLAEWIDAGCPND